MDVLKGLILGIVQGLTEFLPVSSSGHIEIGKVLLGVKIEENLTFSVVVHVATVMSTIVVFRKDLWKLTKGVAELRWNQDTKYVSKIILSAVPVIIVGLFLEDQINLLFGGNLIITGSMLLVTAILLAVTYYAKGTEKNITHKDSLVIGIAQALAVIPGISRSGATISTSLLLKKDRTEAARFSFLIVLLPILGKAFLDVAKGDMFSSSIGVVPLLAGFVSAFIVGLVACKLMIRIVKNSKLIYFAIYCALVGGISIFLSLTYFV